jgi:hypothetical protein
MVSQKLMHHHHLYGCTSVMHFPPNANFRDVIPCSNLRARARIPLLCCQENYLALARSS